MTMKCELRVDEKSGVVEIRGRRGELLAMMKCEPSAFGTWTRLEPGHDADNYWICLKPSDDTVFGDRDEGRPPLFGDRTELVVEEFRFRLEKK